MLPFPGYTNYSIWQNDSSTVIIRQISVLLTYIEGRQMVAPKLLNIQFERHRVLFQLLVNTKMGKSGIRFGHRTWCQCNSTPGVKVLGYMCQFNIYWFTFWGKNLCFTWKTKWGGDNSRTSTWSWLCMDITFFFFHNLATYCSSLLDLRCNIFFRYLFIFFKSFLRPFSLTC